MKTRNATTILILFFLLAWQPVIGQNGSKMQYTPTRISQAPEIDGLLDEPAWEQGQWDGGFTQFEPQNGRVSAQHTEFCILYDDNYLYVGIRAFDSAPDSIVSRVTRRDQNEGDAVGVLFDSYYDQRTGFLLGVTAGGTRFDLIMSNDGHNEDPTWDPNWMVRTAINDEGWTAEMRIPFSELRFNKNGSGIWGLQVFRQIHRKGEMSFWQPIPSDAPGLIHMIGEMHGMGDVSPRRTFDVVPYMVTSAEGYQAQAGNPFSPGREQHLKAGLDAKIGLTNNFTLDLTINPDFGQVEADPSEVNLSAFETFFQERRPFFVEGRSISSFSLGIGDGGLGNDNLFYSRRIGRRPAGSIQVNGEAFVDQPSHTNILGAAKLTGKTEDGLSLAIIQSVTAETQAQIDLHGDRSFQTIEPLTNYFVGRVQQDLNEGNTLLGGMFTSTHRKLDENLSRQMHSQAYSGGLDFTQYFSDKSWMFNAAAALSHVAGSETAILRTQRAPARYFQRPDVSHVNVDPDRTSLTGTGGRLQLAKTGSGNWNFMASVLWKSPEFEINDLGYMREADQLMQLVWLGYRQREPKGLYRSFNVNVSNYNLWNFAGEGLANGFNVNGNINWRNFWSTWGGAEYNHNILSGNHLRGGPAFRLPDRFNSWFGGRTDYRKDLVLNLSGNYSRGMNDHMWLFRFGPSISYKPVDNLNVAFSPSYMERFEAFQYVRETSYNGQARYVLASMEQTVVNFSFRVNYAITPDLTVQYWGQPFVASGRFYDFKHTTNPRDRVFENRFHQYTPEQISFLDGAYSVDENLDGSTDYRFGNPDFNVREFLSNMVVRWEFNPGSSIYLVWSQTRSGFDNQGEMDFFNDLDRMFSVKPHNIFLLKFSYRFGLR
jgi:hypothetical protein